MYICNNIDIGICTCAIPNIGHPKGHLTAIARSNRTL